MRRIVLRTKRRSRSEVRRPCGLGTPSAPPQPVTISPRVEFRDLRRFLKVRENKGTQDKRLCMALHQAVLQGEVRAFHPARFTIGLGLRASGVDRLDGDSTVRVLQRAHELSRLALPVPTVDPEHPVTVRVASHRPAADGEVRARCAGTPRPFAPRSAPGVLPDHPPLSGFDVAVREPATRCSQGCSSRSRSPTSST